MTTQIVVFTSPLRRTNSVHDKIHNVLNFRFESIKALSIQTEYCYHPCHILENKCTDIYSHQMVYF
jgi:hypothetical protein